MRCFPLNINFIIIIQMGGLLVLEINFGRRNAIIPVFNLSS